jgi:hypothetical protein
VAAGWVDKGDWTIKATNVAPTVGTLTPIPVTTEAERPQPFAAVYSDADGYANLKTAELRVGPATGINVWATYDRNANKLYLKDDGGVTLPIDCAPGTTGTLENSQGSINCQQTTVSVTGNDLTVNWNITPKTAFASTTAKSVAMQAKDNSAATSGWKTKGNWKIIATNTAPTLGTLTPSPVTSPAGKPQTFTTVYKDTDGYPNLKTVELRVGPATGLNGIWTIYDRAANRLYLKDDTGLTTPGGCTPGSEEIIHNTQGALNCEETTVSGSGNNLTITWNITPAAGYISGTARQLWMTAQDNSDATSGWAAKGKWTIGPSPITITVSAPLNDDTINGPHVMIKGDISNTTGNETGVTVNGITAMVYGGQFVANHIPLTEGVNTITIAAVDTAENSTSTSITVTAVMAGDYIRVNANPESGVAPLDTTLRVDGSFSITDPAITVSGPAPAEILTSADPAEYDYRMTVEGIYYFTASAAGPDSNTYEDTVGILVLNKDQLDTLLKNIWTATMTRLSVKDTSAALSYISSATKSMYKEMFNYILDQLPAITATQQELNFLYTTDNLSKYELVTLEYGSLYSYEVTFSKDTNGIWKILQY